MQKRAIYKCLAVLSVVMLMTGCQLFVNQRDDDEVLAEVYSMVLTRSQVEKLIPDNIKGLDSVQFVQSYVERWIRSQLMLAKAMVNIDEKSMVNIGNMVNDYRTSLLVYKYQQMYIEQNLDTLILDSQIAAHYDMYGVNFLLDSCAVKAVFVQVPKSLPDKTNIRKLIRSGKPEDMIALEEFCYKNARDFDVGSEWRYLNSVIVKLPANAVPNPAEFAKSGKYAEAQDSLYNYYFMVREFRDVNEQAPIVFAKDKIREILLNHRKNDMIKDLEQKIYIDAVNKQRFTNYVN